MKSSKLVIYLIAIGILLSKAFAQTKEVLPASKTFHFNKGLLINAPARYGREALYTDELAYKLYTNTLKIPADGENFGNDDKGQPMGEEVNNTFICA